MVRPVFSSRLKSHPPKIQHDPRSPHLDHDHRLSLSKRRSSPTRLVALSVASVIFIPCLISFFSIREPSSSSPASYLNLSALQALPKPSLTPRSAFHPPNNFPHHCTVLHVARSRYRNDDESDPIYPFNSRAYCLTSAICLRPATQLNPATLYTAASLQKTTCENVTTSFTPYPPPNNCTTIQSLALCAHGRFLPPRTPVCPRVLSFSQLPPAHRKNAQWLDGIAFIVPAYPHLGNIFHFSFVAGTVSHLAAILPSIIRRWRNSPVAFPQPIPVTLIFRTHLPQALGLWQDAAINAIINQRLAPIGIKVNVTSFPDTPDVPSNDNLLCARTALLVGKRSHINLWPFPSTSYVDNNGSSVSVESIAFRHALYTHSGIKTILPPLRMGTFETPPSHIVSDLPPLVIGYSRRNTVPDASDGNPQIGTKRRFSDADEGWFVSMLKEEAAVSNMTLVTLEITERTPMDEQVQQFSNVGLLVGIHGANLMNSIFMRPFGGLIEAFSALNLRCYVAGANSGLSYWRYQPVRKATPQESGCTEEHKTCWLYGHNRRVMIGEEADHVALRGMVRQGIAHVRRLHEQFGSFGGVPAVYDEAEAMYRVDWARSRG